MSDVFDSHKRNAIMRAIGNKDTKPEMTARRLVHGMGYRYRLHVRSLPGCPDLVFPSRKKIIFIHGCFWHRHSCRKGRSLPQTRAAFWREKLEGNRRRDQTHRRKLQQMGWRVMTVWECQIAAQKLDKLANRMSRFLEE